MDGFIDHYTVLGLPSGEESSKLTKEEISKAYKVKALELHPDKRPDDPNAHDKFQSLNASYKILKDEKERAIFDAKLSSKRAQQRTQILRNSKRDAKRQKMVSDLDRAEARAAASAAQDKADEEERRERRFREDLERIRVTIAKEQAEAAAAAAAAASFSVPKRETSGVAKELDKEKEKMLKVSWEKVGEGYTATRLRRLFSKFGEVEDIVTKDSKKRGRALVVMATKDAAVAARTFSGDPPNSLLIEPLEPVAAPTDAPPVHKEDKPEAVSSQVGEDHQVSEGHQRFRDAVLKKLQKAAQKQQVSDF